MSVDPAAKQEPVDAPPARKVATQSVANERLRQKWYSRVSDYFLQLSGQ